jgi:hypothetical protein
MDHDSQVAAASASIQQVQPIGVKVRNNRFRTREGISGPPRQASLKTVHNGFDAAMRPPVSQAVRFHSPGKRSGADGADPRLRADKSRSKCWPAACSGPPYSYGCFLPTSPNLSGRNWDIAVARRTHRARTYWYRSTWRTLSHRAGARTAFQNLSRMSLKRQHPICRLATNRCSTQRTECPKINIVIYV